MLQNPIIEIDLHGFKVEEAVRKVRSLVNKSGTGTYRIRVIHGYHRGTNIREAIYRELGRGLEPKIKRITPGDNPGVTELVLKEYC